MKTYYFIAYEKLYKATFKTGLMHRWHKEENALLSSYCFETNTWVRLDPGSNPMQLKIHIVKTYILLTAYEAVGITLIGESELKRRIKGEGTNTTNSKREVNIK